MSDWTDDDPGAGDLSTLGDRAQKLALKAQHAGEMQALVQQQEAIVAGAWTGTGHDGWANKAAQTTVAWATLQTWASNEQKALGSYVDTVTGIKRRADAEKGRLADAKADAAAAEWATSMTEAVPLTSGSGLPSPSPGPAPVAPGNPDLDRAHSAYNSAMKALAAERQQADDALVASIRDAYVEVTAAGTPVLPAGLTEESLAGMTPTTLLTTLSSLSATELADLMAAEPAIAQDFWTNPPEATTASSWWAALSDDQRAALLAGAPSVIGNLGGVPYADRIVANQNQLDQAAARSALTKAQRGTVEQANKALGSGSRRIPRGVVDLNLESDPPFGAIAIGDVDTADKVTWSVPGMDNTAAASLNGWTVAGRNLLDQQDSVDPTSSHAVVSWIGYETPTLDATEKDFSGSDSVLSNSLAKKGAGRLASELDALYSTRAVSESGLPRIAVAAHSYGTTVSAYALNETQYDVDSVTFTASAGIDSSVVSSAADLHVDSSKGHQNVYATQASKDATASIGRNVDPHLLGLLLSGASGSPYGGNYDLTRDLQSIPSNNRINPDSDFGAIPYSSEGNGELLQTLGHGALGEGGLPTFSTPRGQGYYDKNTQSLWNMAVTTTGTGRISAPAPQSSVVPR